MNPFTQGSGLSNIKSALDYVHGNNGVFIVSNDASYGNLKEVLTPALTPSKFNYNWILKNLYFPSKSFPMTSWFAGQLLPGERTTTTFRIENPTDETLTISINPNTLSLIEKTQFDGVTIVQQQDSVLNETGNLCPKLC